MDHARYIGRIGALAVTLGVGYAVATTPGIALAAPADSGSSSSPAGGSPTSGESDGTGSPAPGPQSPSDSPDGESIEGSAVSGDAGEDAVGVVDAGDDAADADDGGEEALSSSDEEDPSTDDEDASLAVSDDDSAAGDFAEQRTSSRSAGSRSARSFAAVDTADDEDSSLSAGKSTPTGAQAQKFSIDDATAGAPALRSSIAPAVANAVTTVAPPPLPVTPAPPPDLDEILEEPHTFLVGVIAHVVDAVLEPFLAPFAPGSPGGVPLLWTMLAFVRDEFNRIVFPNMSTDPTPSLVDDPNLLVNPDAELGDPSLSGYATVSVPGWAVAGTPTVIKYGTQRRFPVPTSSPGPVLPSLLAFPGQGDPGSGQQFFGGGPVADSTLTQTVDLRAAADAIDHRAGGVQYELSGDLGGFLIDPSRTKVSVNFLDANGASLGTGEIKPVTALDRWFATGFMHRNVVGSVPVGARRAQVVVSFVDHNPVLGNYNNAYADNLSFKVDADGLAPAALTPPESTVGGLDHVFMVYMENKGVGQILGSPNAPYINALINQYGYASNYYGLTHPSDPNYYPIIGGSDFGFNFNCPSNCFPAGTPNLADRIEAAGLRWAGYMDGGGGYTSPTRPTALPRLQRHLQRSRARRDAPVRHLGSGTGAGQSRESAELRMVLRG